MKTMPKKTKPSKASLKIKPLSPRTHPKGGRRGGCDDEFGCGTNHNEVVVVEAVS